MLYHSWLYLIVFLSISVFLYYQVPVKFRWCVLLYVSLIFYMVTAGLLVGFVLFSAFTIYAAGLFIERLKSGWNEKKKRMDREERKKSKQVLEKKKKEIIAIVCLINLGILIICKYYNFLGNTLNIIFYKMNASIMIPKLKLLVPLGISFYTLSAISYITDVGRGICEAEKNYGKLLLYLIFFPTITEGPIERYESMGKQFCAEHHFSYHEFCLGLQLILWGLFQKVVLADRLNVYVSAIFSKPQKYSGLPVILAVLFYTFQIYMDFSGCINIARGSAELFGIYLTENFRQPFFSATVAEFWRRWHISLGTWFKDYIFYPVSLSKSFQNINKRCRKSMSPYYAATIPGIFALFFVWISNGIWHGSEWKYIIYGMYYYLIMVTGMLVEPFVDKFFKRIHINRSSKEYHFFQQIRTFLFVNIGMLIFRAKDFKAAIKMCQSVIQPYTYKEGFFQWICDVGGLKKLDLLLITVSVIFLILYGKYKENGGQLCLAISQKPVLVRWPLYFLAVLSVLMIGAYGPGFGVADFIYAQF